MSASKKSAGGENPPPRASLPKNAKLAKSTPIAKKKAPPSDPVDRARASTKSVSPDLHPGHNVHPLGHNPSEKVRILARPPAEWWASVDANGGGLYALAHWLKFLEERGVPAVSDAAEASGGFLRGLTHR